MSTYSPIATQTLTSTATTVTFTNIPQGYNDLILQVNDQVSSASGFKIQFNGDTAANYLQIQMGGYNSSSSAAKVLGASSIYNNLVYGDSTTANVYTPNIIEIQNYSNSYAYKSLLWRYGTAAAAGGNGETFLIAGSWNSNAPITSITVSVWNAVNFNAGSSFSLYGIAAGSTKAQGGLVTNDGTYYYHTFLSSGVFTPYQALTVDYLVVAGGGGGGQNTGGGGGAGGYRTSLGSSTLSLTAQNYPVIIGAGGLGGSSQFTSQGFNGSNSSFSTITASGGGGGGGSATLAGLAGGSGGGASRGAIAFANGGAGNSGSYSPVEGYAGGSNGGVGSGNSGGGGGAGAVGVAALLNVSGAGGAGRNTNSAWATATNTGVSGYYAGGGGGGAYNGTAGAGGAGGGGAGSFDNTAVPGNGVTNTGSGGGGQNNNNNPPNGNRGANGGSGIVIVRYAI